MLTFIECLMSGIPALNQALMSIGIDALQAIFQERAVEEHIIMEIKDWRRKLKNRYYFLYFQGKVRLILKYFFTWLEKIFIPQTCALLFAASYFSQLPTKRKIMEIIFLLKYPVNYCRSSSLDTTDSQSQAFFSQCSKMLKIAYFC